MTTLGPQFAMTSAFLNQVRVDLDMSTGRRSNLSNIGILSEPTWRIRDHNWVFPDKAPQDSNGWATIMTQCTRTGDATELLLKTLKKLKSSDQEDN